MLINDATQPRILIDMFGMLLSIVTKQKEIENVVEQVKNNTARIEDLEAKIGNPSDVNDQIGICIKNLPFPSPGESELTNVQKALSHIKAPNVDVTKHVRKVVRVGSREGYVGVVKVELNNEKTRASIMKNKKVLNKQS